MGNISEKTLVNVARGLDEKRIPVWFMRQAGRYLPEYMELRAKHSFVECCQTPEIAAEITIQPLRRFDLDAAIIFSDILIPCIGMGQELTFGKGHGPQLAPAMRSERDLLALKLPDAQRDLGYVGDAIAKTKPMLTPQQTMIGFAGAPFTVATYMVEGSGTKHFTEIKKLVFGNPQLLEKLLTHIAQATVDYLCMQIDAGADTVMLFDTWAGQLPSEDYRRLIFPVTAQLIRDVQARRNVPVIYYSGQGSDNLAQLSDISADVLAIDWRTPIDRAVSILDDAGVSCTVQGNLDPQVLVGNEQFIRERTESIIQRARKSGVRGHIFNVGHGLLPHTPPQALEWVISSVRACESKT